MNSKAIRARELLRSSTKSVSYDTFRQMCQVAPLVLQAVMGELCIPDFQVERPGLPCQCASICLSPALTLYVPLCLCLHLGLSFVASIYISVSLAASLWPLVA